MIESILQEQADYFSVYFNQLEMQQCIYGNIQTSVGTATGVLVRTPMYKTNAFELN